MKSFHSLVLALVAACFCLATSSPALAQATRTWVSGVGDDANPCSRTAPCKTFAGAIAKTAKGGEINAIDAGGYGSVTITKSITIDGSGTTGSILGAQTNGIVVNITAADDSAKTVRIRGLSINGAGTGLQGIKLVAGNRVLIEDTVIHGFKDGIAVTAPDAKVFVLDSTISNNSGSGISVSSSGSQVALSGVTVVDNGTGLASSGGGTIVSFKNNVIHGNGKDGEPSSAAAQK